MTAKVTETLTKAIGADIFEIEPKVPYTDAALNWVDKKARSTIEMNNPASRPEKCREAGQHEGLRHHLYGLSNLVVRCADDYQYIDLTGKTNERLAPSCKGAKLPEGKAFKGNVGHQELAAWVEGLVL